MLRYKKQFIDTFNEDEGFDYYATKKDLVASHEAVQEAVDSLGNSLHNGSTPVTVILNKVRTLIVLLPLYEEALTEDFFSHRDFYAFLRGADAESFPFESSDADVKAGKRFLQKSNYKGVDMGITPKNLALVMGDQMDTKIQAKERKSLETTIRQFYEWMPKGATLESGRWTSARLAPIYAKVLNYLVRLANERKGRKRGKQSTDSLRKPKDLSPGRQIERVSVEVGDYFDPETMIDASQDGRGRSKGVTYYDDNARVSAVLVEGLRSDFLDLKPVVYVSEKYRYVEWP